MSWSGRRFFAWVCLMACVAECSGFILLYWTADVSVRVGNLTSKPCECGLYGQDSPLLGESGLVVLPNEDPQACNHTTFSVSQSPWIALIKRGNCTYKEKISAATKYNASAVVIYNLDGTGNETNTMSHSGTGGVVVVMIGNELGKDIASLVHAGHEVFMNIELGNPHGPWANPIWIYIMSFTFFAVTAVTMAYFTILSVKKIHQHIMLRREQNCRPYLEVTSRRALSLSGNKNSKRQLKSVAQKAIEKLKVRTLRKGDEEVGSDNHTCAVCIEGYKHLEPVMILTCGHFFHKPCIEPWLLEHRTCPMCKCNILGVKTVDEEVSVGSTPSPLDVRFYPDSRLSPFYENLDEVELSDPEEDTPPAQQTSQEPIEAGPKPEQNQGSTTEFHQIYDNLAFEGDSNKMDLK
ncbi:RING finger protein 148-like isoform X1 [Alosa alosa]|uniref:RING finger protein 148-like isoform X1 n=1 Tax=Alosa alosa TaxID=278164 RepID=UPI0020151581|nr:RING finger protein 148-like isoform X1 [Alosa alosa]